MRNGPAGCLPAGPSAAYGSRALPAPLRSGLLQDPPVGGDGHHLPRNKFSALLQCCLCGVFQPAAAGDLHPHDGHALDVVAADDLRQLLGVIHAVQLRAETGKDTVELAVMGVLKEYHRKGIGKELFNRAKKAAKEMGYSFIQVKTVQMGKYKSYDDTNRFYISIGFKEFEVFPTLWDKWNPCQIYVMGI